MKADPKKIVIRCRLSTPEYQALQDMAATDKTTVSDVIRRCIYDKGKGINLHT